MLVTQSCPILCNPIRCRPLGSSVHGILQARILKWVAIPFSRGSSWPRDQAWVSHTAGEFFTVWGTRGAHEYHSVYSIPSSGDLPSTGIKPGSYIAGRCSLPGSSVHGILQARILEWDAISFSRGFSWPRDGILVSFIGGKFFTIWAIREAQWVCTWLVEKS